MTEDMPEDVKAHARELWSQVGAIDADPPHVIAHAILAERRRCAQIAEAEQEAMERAAYSYRVPASEANVRLAYLHDQGATVAGRIAAAIRGDGNGEG